MITLWISASLLALTGWQGYRLGKEYGWWASPLKPEGEKTATTVTPETTSPKESGLGRSKTDFNRLLDGFSPAEQQPTLPGIQDVSANNEEQPIIEPKTTLMDIGQTSDDTEYPEETDQIPEACNWMDEEAILLVEDEGNEVLLDAEPTVVLHEYVKRVRTVQRKMTQLTKRRQADSAFVKQELGVLINTYHLENDQSLDWLFQQHETSLQTDYGSVFDQIEKLTN